MTRDPAIAYFVSPHGYGHAARSAAVMAALATRRPGTRVEVYTTVPRWFFAQSLPAPFGWHAVATDVGLAQRDALTVDLEATVAALESFLPFSSAALDPLAGELDAEGCRAVVCDVSPLGLAVARHLGVPAMLVENFTWDWVYRNLAGSHPALARFVEVLEELYATADLRVQTTPLCRPHPTARVVRPVCRRPRAEPATTRRRLGVPLSAPLVLLTMGGIPWRHRDLSALAGHDQAFFVVPGASESHERRGRLVTIPHHSRFFHPDLVAASDAVVGKLGYSTVAEVHAAGAAFAYVPRPDFPESPVLAEYCRDHLTSLPLPPDALDGCGWLAAVDELLAQPHRPPGRADGAEEVAELLAGLLA